MTEEGLVTKNKRTNKQKQTQTKQINGIQLMDAIFIACMLYRGNHPYTSFEGADDYFQEDSK